jgi:hypothetical protein
MYCQFPLVILQALTAIKTVSFDQPKTGYMELQAPFTNELKSQSSINVYRQLFQIQIELERLIENHPQLSEEAGHIIQSIDELFEIKMKNGSDLSPSNSC